MNDRLIEIEAFYIGVVARFNKAVSNFKKDRLSLAAPTFVHIATAWMNGKAHFTNLALAVQRGYRKADRREYEKRNQQYDQLVLHYFSPRPSKSLLKQGLIYSGPYRLLTSLSRLKKICQCLSKQQMIFDKDPGKLLK